MAPDCLGGGVIVLFGVWCLWQATLLREGPGYAAVGPRVFPLLVSGGILLSGMALILSHHDAPSAVAVESVVADTEDAPADWPTLIGAAGMLAGYLLLFQVLGFVFASTAFLVGCSWVLGSRSPIRDLAAGLGTSLIAYLVFTRLLGLELPAGPLAALG
jgi:putative tricarboxylic transport membrane protein